MESAIARVAMETPGRYLDQLCRHFAHKLPVTQDDASGSIGFTGGICRLVATETALVMTLDAAGGPLDPRPRLIRLPARDARSLPATEETLQ